MDGEKWMGYRRALSIVKESSMANFVSIILGTLGGVILNSRFEALLALPPLLALIPPLSDMAGDFGLMIGARLITALKLGYIRPKVLFRSIVLRKNVMAILTVGCFASTYLGVITILSSYIVGLPMINPLEIFETAFLSGLILVTVVTVSGIILSVLSLRSNLDLSPLSTSIGDLSGPVCLIVVAWSLRLI